MKSIPGTDFGAKGERRRGRGEIPLSLSHLQSLDHQARSQLRHRGSITRSSVWAPTREERKRELSQVKEEPSSKEEKKEDTDKKKEEKEKERKEERRERKRKRRKTRRK